MGVKERILRLSKIFIHETDGEHTLSVRKIIQIFEERYAEKVSMGTIKNDLNTLIYFYIIDCVGEDKYGAKLYSKVNRKFENYELRMLIDAVHSGRFMTPEDSSNLICKIKSLASEHMAKKMENKIFISDCVVCEDPKIKYYINDLHEAVQEGKVIQFKYQKYDLNIKFKFKNEGKPYIVEPYGVVWQNSFYYLVGYSRKHKDFINFRIDRMVDVKKLNEKFEFISFDLGKYVKSCFNMYPGEIIHIELKFHHHLINAIIDYFGKDLDITVAEDKEYFIIKTKAAYNKGLVRWLLTWGSDMEVIYPQYLINDIKQETEKMYNIYHKIERNA